MEQEPERELLSYTLRYIGYRLRAGAHIFFILMAALIAGWTVVVLVFSN